MSVVTYDSETLVSQPFSKTYCAEECYLKAGLNQVQFLRKPN